MLIKLFIGLLALLAGVASSTQGLYNGFWKDELDLKTILLVNSLVVLALALILFMMTYNDGVKLSFDKFTPTILVGGACGFFIIMAFSISFPVIGATASSLIFIIGLLSASLFYDYIGALNLVQEAVSVKRILGILLVIAGTFLALKSS